MYNIQTTLVLDLNQQELRLEIECACFFHLSQIILTKVGH